MLHKYNSPDNDGFQRLVERLKIYAEKAEETVMKKGGL
jgi:hypothetical protein